MEQTSRALYLLMEQLHCILQVHLLLEIQIDKMQSNERALKNGEISVGQRCKSTCKNYKGILCPSLLLSSTLFVPRKSMDLFRTITWSLQRCLLKNLELQ